MTISEKPDREAPRNRRGKPGTVALELELRHAPQKVWRALTEPRLLAQWLLPVIDDALALEPGAAFALQTQPFPDWDGTVRCRMIEIEPHRKLSYAWAVPTLDTVVTFTLTPIPTGTRLSIEQSGFALDQKQELGGARYGWQMMTERLVELLDTQRTEETP